MEIWACRLFSSTIRPGQTRSIRRSLLATVPPASISVSSRSKARAPSLIGRPSANSSRSCGTTRKRPNVMLAPGSVGSSIVGDIGRIQGEFRFFQRPAYPTAVRVGMRARLRPLPFREFHCHCELPPAGGRAALNETARASRDGYSPSPCGRGLGGGVPCGAAPSPQPPPTRGGGEPCFLLGASASQ